MYIVFICCLAVCMSARIRQQCWPQLNVLLVFRFSEGLQELHAALPQHLVVAELDAGLFVDRLHGVVL